MLNIQRHRKHLIAQKHIDNGQIYQHLEVEIRVLPFSWPLFNLREARSIRTKPEIVIILREVRYRPLFGDKGKANALALQMLNLLTRG